MENKPVPKFTVAGRIARPVEDVFEAIVNPDKLSAYFTTGGAKGRMETGATVTWDFHDFPGAFPVKVVEVVQNEKIVLQWEAAAESEVASTGDNSDGAGYDTTVTISFEQLNDGRTRLSITEEGWRQTPFGFKSAFGNCEGWTGMLCALKVWIEHGINLRQDFYK